MMKVVKLWHRLPREMVDAPSLELFQAKLDGVLSNLVWLKMSLLMARGWTRWPLKVPSNPNYSVISGDSFQPESFHDFINYGINHGMIKSHGFIILY